MHKTFETMQTSGNEVEDKNADEKVIKRGKKGISKDSGNAL